MKERPILFQGAMVRAILADLKLQTRRLVKASAPSEATSAGVFFAPGKAYDAEWNWLSGDPRDCDSWCSIGDAFRCPYGQPGDRLWVREAFIHEPADYCWEASVSIPCRPASTVYRADFPDSKPGEGWKPSIHMPRALCRLVLEIADVRVERLQDISEADADAEGCDRLHDDEPGFVYRDEGNPDWNICPRCGGTRQYTEFSGNGGALPGTDCGQCDTYAKRYRHLWESINGADSWASNPWVWVVEFRRVTQ